MVLAFCDGDVAIDWKVGQPGDRGGRLWPSDLHPVHFGAPAKPKNHAWIVRGQITAATHLGALPLQISALVSDLRTHRVDIGPGADQLDSQPVILSGGL